MGFREQSLGAGERRRVRGRVVAVLVTALATVAAWTHWRTDSRLRVDADDATLVTQGEAIYRSHCAGCHGVHLEGQANWRQRRADGRLPAPPHDAEGHTWHHPDEMLIGMVREGFQTGTFAPPGYQSDMPAYGEILERYPDHELSVRARYGLAWASYESGEFAGAGGQLEGGAVMPPVTNVVADAEGALIALGYKPQEASRAVAAVNDDTVASSEDLIRRALKSMVSGK